MRYVGFESTSDYYKHVKCTPSVEQCEVHCSKDPRCGELTYYSVSNLCVLKKVSYLKTMVKIVSGLKNPKPSGEKQRQHNSRIGGTGECSTPPCAPGEGGSGRQVI